MIVCSGCGRAIEDDLQFCTECGTPNPTTRTGETTVSLGSAPTPQGSVSEPRFQNSPTLQKTAPFNQVRPGGVTPQANAPVQQAATSPNRTPLIIICAVVSGLLLLVLGAVGSRVLLSDNKPAETASGTAQTATRPTDLPTAPEPTGTQSQNQTPARSAAPAFDEGSLRREVTDTLNNWTAATRSHDLDGHVSYYADTLDFYFQRTNVSRGYVRASLAPAYTRYHTLDVQISNISVAIDQSGTVATATFDKTYHFEGDKILEGSVQELLTLRKIDGRWLITGARDLRVYYTNK